MTNWYDVIIVGGGPAGMATAIEAKQYGLSVIVLDEHQTLGGQIYKAVTKQRINRHKLLGDDYFYGRALIKKFVELNIQVCSKAKVWQLDTDGDVIYSQNNQSQQIKGKQIVLAAGAMERPVPIPGWTLPGVMGAAAADTMLKSSDLVPSESVVLAGNGPLLLLIAHRLIGFGVQVKGIVYTGTAMNYLKALPYFHKALEHPKLLIKGIKLQWQLLKSGIPTYRNIEDLKALGTDQVSAVSFTCGGSRMEIDTDHLLLHDGVIPNSQISKMVGCDHHWDALQRYWVPSSDAWGQSSLDRYSVVGDLSGVAGAMAAEMKGRLAGLNMAFRLGRISKSERDWKARPFRKNLNRELAIRPFLDRLYPPSMDLLVPSDPKTMVCRCEEVTAGEIREAVAINSVGPNQIKTQTRCGMGACQGRMCGSVSSEIIAQQLKISAGEAGYLRVRPPLKPISIDEMIGVKTE